MNRRQVSRLTVLASIIVLACYQAIMAKKVPQPKLRLSDGLPFGAGDYYLWLWLMPILLILAFQALGFADLQKDMHLYQLTRYRFAAVYWFKQLGLILLTTLLLGCCYQWLFNSVLAGALVLGFTLKDLCWQLALLTVISITFTVSLLTTPILAVGILFVVLVVGVGLDPTSLVGLWTLGLKGLMTLRLAGRMSASLLENGLFLLLNAGALVLVSKRADIGGDGWSK